MGLRLKATTPQDEGPRKLWLGHKRPAGLGHLDFARTAAFAGMVVFEKLSVFAFRSLTQPCWKIGWFSNPFLLGALVVSLGLQVVAVYWSPLQLLLQTVALDLGTWMTIAALGAPLVIVPEIVKTFRTSTVS